MTLPNLLCLKVIMPSLYVSDAGHPEQSWQSKYLGWLKDNMQIIGVQYVPMDQIFKHTQRMKRLRASTRASIHKIKGLCLKNKTYSFSTSNHLDSITKVSLDLFKVPKLHYISISPVFPFLKIFSTYHNQLVVIIFWTIHSRLEKFY